MKKNTLKFALAAAILGIGLTFNAKVALAADVEACDGVWYNDGSDGDISRGDALEAENGAIIECIAQMDLSQ